jgi:hypothetical protein
VTRGGGADDKSVLAVLAPEPSCVCMYICIFAVSIANGEVISFFPRCDLKVKKS